MTKTSKVLFCGTHIELALPALHALFHSSYTIAAVVTAPDKRKGRGQKTTLSPIKQFALDHHIPVLQPTTLKSDEAYSDWLAFDIDFMVVAGYGMILPSRYLELPRISCLNIHPSLLPKWRGASPVQAAILNGDHETGVSIIELNDRMDAGDIVNQVTHKLTGQETSPDLMSYLAKLGAKTLIDSMDMLRDHQSSLIKQDDTLATYCPKLSKSDANIDFNQSAIDIDARVRALQPWPSTSICCEDGLTIKVISCKYQKMDHSHQAGLLIDIDQQHGALIACSTDAIWIQNIQLPNKKPTTAYQVSLGHPHRFKKMKAIFK